MEYGSGFLQELLQRKKKEKNMYTSAARTFKQKYLQFDIKIVKSTCNFTMMSTMSFETVSCTYRFCTFLLAPIRYIFSVYYILFAVCLSIWVNNRCKYENQQSKMKRKVKSSTKW